MKKHVWLSAGGLVAVLLSIGTILAAGGPFVISASPLATASNDHGGQIAFTALSQIWIINADGSGQRSLPCDISCGDPSWSPDGQHIALTGWTSLGAKINQIYVMNTDGSDFTVLSPPTLNGSPFSASHPTWSPDGQWIAFKGWRVDSDEGSAIYVMGKDGSGLHALTNPRVFIGVQHPAWSPDGQSIAFDAYRNYPSVDTDIYVMQADGANPHPVTHTGYNIYPTWSPDSRRIAFMSDRNADDYDIYIINSDGTHLHRVTYNPAWDGEPAWSPDGKRLAFASSRQDDASWALYTVNIDSTGLRRVSGDLPVVGPKWRPLPRP